MAARKRSTVIVGKRFDAGTILGRAVDDSTGETCALFQCNECPKIGNARLSQLKSGVTRSCGCLRRKAYRNFLKRAEQRLQVGQRKACYEGRSNNRTAESLGQQYGIHPHVVNQCYWTRQEEIRKLPQGVLNAALLHVKGRQCNLAEKDNWIEIPDGDMIRFTCCELRQIVQDAGCIRQTELSSMQAARFVLNGGKDDDCLLYRLTEAREEAPAHRTWGVSGYCGEFSQVMFRWLKNAKSGLREVAGVFKDLYVLIEKHGLATIRQLLGPKVGHLAEEFLRVCLETQQGRNERRRTAARRAVEKQQEGPLTESRLRSEAEWDYWNGSSPAFAEALCCTA